MKFKTQLSEATEMLNLQKVFLYLIHYQLLDKEKKLLINQKLSKHSMLTMALFFIKQRLPREDL